MVKKGLKNIEQYLSHKMQMVAAFYDFFIREKNMPYIERRITLQ